MRTIHTTLTLILGLALILSLMMWRRTQRELQQQLHTVTDANEVLRETLGELTVAITDKDKQIDRLLRSLCEIPEGEHTDSRRVPPSHKLELAKPSKTGWIGAN